MSAPPPEVAVVLPLPSTLAHYGEALTDTLLAAGFRPVVQPTTSFERPDAGRARKLLVAVSAIGERVRAPRGRPTVVAWPGFGLADPVTWLRQRSSTLLVIHDPRPLRSQHGMGAPARRLGRWAARGGVQVVVHSQPAEDVLSAWGWPRPVRALHPLVTPAAVNKRPSQQVVVFGQWKPTRTLEPLAAVARAVRDHDLVVAGRGWPAVPGWTREDRFLTESEVDQLIAGAAAVVLPYSTYFQSGVAVRALENLTPVVGLRHPHLVELFGETWPGIVERNEWGEAVRRVADLDPKVLRGRRQAYWVECVASWSEALGPLMRSDGPSAH